MKLAFATVVLAAAAASCLLAQEPATYVDQAKVAEVFSKGGALSSGSGYTASGARRTAAGVVGGLVQQLKKGDFITIPAGTPHWFKEVPSTGITYYMVKVIKP